MTNNNKVVTIDYHKRKASFLDNNTFSDAPLYFIYLE